LHAVRAPHAQGKSTFDDAPTERLSDAGISLDHLQDLAMNFFSKTRWSRTFSLIHPYDLTPQ
jgi:hypothetical protein